MSRPADRVPEAPRHDDTGASERSEVREAVERFLVIGLIVLVLVAIPVAFLIRAQAESHALENVRLMTQRLADYAIGPWVTEELLAGDPASLRALETRLAPWMEEGAVVRIRVWDSAGWVVYSDVGSLIGLRTGLPPAGRALLAGRPSTATLENRPELENVYQAGSGEVVEVYVKSLAADGQPLVFEAYYNDDGVRQEETAVLLGMAPAFLLSLAFLQLAHLMPAVRLARRIQAHQATRRRLLQNALEASDLERQRIARDLHDEVIQDLAGLSYALEAEEMRGPAEQRPLFAQARSILQHNVRTLRAMTTELYPPDLDQLGLPDALTRLTGPLGEQGVEVILQLPERSDLDLNRKQAAMFYRVAREVLANTAKHARAGTLELSLSQDTGRTVLLIHDDGRGFDQDAASPDGHLGLRIMQDTIHEAGGTLEVTSRPGWGTSVVATLNRAPVRNRCRIP